MNQENKINVSANNANPKERKPRREFKKEAPVAKEFEEVVVSINHVTKVVKGGRRYRFSAVVVVGDKKGRVGLGTGKAIEVPDAIKKAVEDAKKNLITVPIVDTSIPHEVTGVYGAGRVFLRPAPDGTGIIAGGPVRAIMDAVGATDVLSRSLGSRSTVNVVRATFNAIQKLMDAKAVAAARGKTLDELWG